MDVIIVPRPKSVRDPNRPVSSLLLAQVKHLRAAEMSLPARYHSGIFSHAIQTEGEAANYVRAVTEAIRDAHDDAAEARRKKTPKRREVISIAAEADETAERRMRNRSKAKKKGRPRGRKK